MLKKILATVAVASLSISPALAATNSASSPSIAKVARANAPAGKQSQLNGGSFGFVGLAILAGIVAIGVIAIVNGDDDDADSN
ncbi:hypothetical protein [Sphingomonas sp.]|uniref:hypothetical protein n=1 Tax=Sphingomonas sp. TaxID=28214 RepID=UPI0035C86216